MNHLEERLKILDEWLGDKNLSVTIHVIGAYGIELHDISIGRRTEDIDNVSPITSEDIIAKIHAIGEQFGEPKWFDLGASSLSLPDGYTKRLKRVGTFENIELYALSLPDIVILKVAAYFDRRERGIERDLEDLIKINPSFVEIKKGLNFIIDTHGADLPDKFKKELKKSVHELEIELKKLFK